MAKEFVKLWLNYESYFESYSAAEVGRLVLAMIKYKSSGAVPEFSGSEKFIWPAIKRDIDVDNEFAETKRKNAKNRTEQTKVTQSKVEQDEARPSKTEQSAKVKVKDNNPLTPLQGDEGVSVSKRFVPLHLKKSTPIAGNETTALMAKSSVFPAKLQKIS